MIRIAALAAVIVFIPLAATIHYARNDIGTWEE